MSNGPDEQQHEAAARNARALLDPDDPPRAFFVGVAYDSGSDFSHGVNKASVDQGEAAILNGCRRRRDDPRRATVWSYSVCGCDTSGSLDSHPHWRVCQACGGVV